jgi:dTDP-4-amino-4,6-dideoxygalactose transaminase
MTGKSGETHLAEIPTRLSSDNLTTPPLHGRNGTLHGGNGIMTVIPDVNSRMDLIKSVPLLDVGRGNAPLKAEIMSAFSDIIDSGWFVGGPHVKSLEQSVAQVSGVEHAIGCASGSEALLLALMAINIQPGDEVICPSFTFFATTSAISRLGATPVFVDIDPDTFNVDPAKLAALVTPKTKAIIPVHLFGQCCDMDPILKFAETHNLTVIEDCAQSIGASDKGRPAGSMGAIGCFSFYPTKNLGGFGDGGMLTASDPEIADRLRLMANHGMKPRYYHQEVGINSRLDAMQAAVLGIKIKHLSEYGEARRENAMRYRALMTRAGIASMVCPPSESAGSCHVWNQFTIRIPDGKRDQVREKLAAMNVGSEIYYPVPMHQQECFLDIPVELGSLTQTERAAAEVLSLPIFPELTAAEQAYVVDCLAQVLADLELQSTRAA